MMNSSLSQEKIHYLNCQQLMSVWTVGGYLFLSLTVLLSVCNQISEDICKPAGLAIIAQLLRIFIFNAPDEKH